MLRHIQRTRHLSALRALLDSFPVVGLLGARQAGKTTLGRDLAAALQSATTWFDLEDPRDLARLADAMLALEGVEGLVVLDEIQRRPEIFPVLRVLADRPGRPARFLVLGSAGPDLLQQSSESLAGRIAYHRLGGLALDEVGSASLDRLWLRGGFPPAYLADSDERSAIWRRNFLDTFLERDLPQLGVRTPPGALRRFWTMVAHYHGQVWNASELARGLGVDSKTVHRYLGVLTSAFVIRQLQPWHENLSKRQVKSPKVYIADCGLLHVLLGLDRQEDLLGHPKVGASWEGFALQETVARLGARPEECFFWATHAGAELDLLVVRGQRRLGFEFKRASAPKITPSMKTALDDLRLEALTVVCPGEETYPMAERIRAFPLARLYDPAEPLY